MQKDNACHYKKRVSRIPCWSFKRLSILRVLLVFLSFENYLEMENFTNRH